MTTIDVATRFPFKSYEEIVKTVDDVEDWVFPELISSSVTMIYGRSNVGKSYLVSSMLLSLLIDGREFLGMEPTDRTKLWRPVILCTDPDSEREYVKRLRAGNPESAPLDVLAGFIGATRTAGEWQALTDYLISKDRNFVVLDNLMGATGDTNEAGIVTTVFDGLSRLVNRGVPVVVLHHESEKGPAIAGAPPMGVSTSVQKSRVWIQVRQTNRRGLRGGNTALIVQSNQLEQPQQIVAEPLTGPEYRVLNRGPWLCKGETEDEPKPKVKRKKATYDERADMARWVVDNCQGKGLNATASALAEKFNKSPATCKEQLMRGALAKLLDRTGDGSSASWSLK